MNARLALGTLALTLTLASCGLQTASAPVAAGDTDRAARTQAPLLGTTNPEAIPGQYIVVLSDGAAGGNLTLQGADGLISSLGLDPQGVSVQQVYTQTIHGFAGKLSTQNLAKLQADPRVKYIEQDARMHMTATQSGATWGIDRIDQRNLPLDGSYTYTTTASGIKAYIIDTGIRTTHSQFGGRAVWGTNTTGDGNNSDCQGHGTHVAGTVGSSTYGVAKGVQLIAVKVLDCAGSGTNSGVIAGVNWAVGNKGASKAVANMSLGGGFSQAVNDAVNSAAGQNLVMVVAAGNENQNACNVSPASAASAITVGATTQSDSRDTSYSNFGSCVDIFAPGTGITSSWNTSDTATNTISGTSMATPHVVGAAALALAGGTSGTSDTTSSLLGNATNGKVTNAGTGSPTRLLFTGSATTPPPSGGSTTYTGSVSAGTSSYKPGSGGFTYAGGTLKATLSGPAGTDFDLYLNRWNGTAWVDVASSGGGTSSESISYAATSGTYRWEVYAYSGSGSYTLVETK